MNRWSWPELREVLNTSWLAGDNDAREQLHPVGAVVGVQVVSRGARRSTTAACSGRWTRTWSRRTCGGRRARCCWPEKSSGHAGIQKDGAVFAVIAVQVVVQVVHVVAVVGDGVADGRAGAVYVADDVVIVALPPAQIDTLGTLSAVRPPAGGQPCACAIHASSVHPPGSRAAVRSAARRRARPSARPRPESGGRGGVKRS